MVKMANADERLLNSYMRFLNGSIEFTAFRQLRYMHFMIIVIYNDNDYIFTDLYLLK